jgi:hypothetical protein
MDTSHCQAFVQLKPLPPAHWDSTAGLNLPVHLAVLMLEDDRIIRWWFMDE